VGHPDPLALCESALRQVRRAASRGAM